MPDSFDALVIGGGPAGATTAILLARAGWSVLVLERKTFPRPKVCGEYLSATNLPLFELLGVGDVFRKSAGPEVRRVGLFAGDVIQHACLPRPNGKTGWGRALSRQHLDTLLLLQAITAGAEVRQPWKAVSLKADGSRHHCQALDQETGKVSWISARIIVAAHGSWETGLLPTQAPRQDPRPGDLFGFKAHFRSSRLPSDLMPLLAFPGGYGGMVSTDRDLVSLSCCIRRDRLAAIRAASSFEAGPAVLRHIMESCAGVREALNGTTREGPWLSAGPIRPGIRLRPRQGIFPVGNAAGEAHPVVAEGISMAMQSAWLLANRLIYWKDQGGSLHGLLAASNSYRRTWLRSFAPRLYASALLARWAMSPASVTSTLPLVRRFPAILTWGARLSGKATQVV